MANRYLDTRLEAFAEFLKDTPFLTGFLAEGALDYLTRRKLAGQIIDMGLEPSTIMICPPTEDEARKWGVVK